MTALLTPTKYTVDPWDPSYGVSVGEEMNGHESSAKDLNVEVAAHTWAPISPDESVPAPSAVVFLDGVRRIDAHVWVHGPDPQPVQGLVASLAAGLVCCDGSGAHVLDVKIDRSLYSAVESATDLRTNYAIYKARHTKVGVQGLMNGVQNRLAELEAELSAAWRERGVEDDLLIVDGPLFGRNHLPRTVGYVKTHRQPYLQPPQTDVVAELEPGQRTPAFLLGTQWDHRYSWYVRLPGGGGGTPWASVVRLECSADLQMDDVVRLADLTTLMLPTLASTPHKDPRAPQNLVPIGGLERQLRHRLGDSALLYRALRAAQRSS